MDSDQESSSSSSSSSSTYSSSSLSDNTIYLNQNMYRTIKKEVFICVDSELKNIYEIDSERMWLEQKETIIIKLLPPLYKYPEKELVRILKESGYHSEEWEETDSNEENNIIGEESAVKKKIMSIHITSRNKANRLKIGYLILGQITAEICLIFTKKYILIVIRLTANQMYFGT
ncbi:hypothetical protein GLOIN_2v1847667 [Rhizophagus irregularis DAOM 181602=DAOM 197198]|uniref:Uncharacterized protein n=1 Tax=Rhizophagus irregularis (strain DAOM 181602 / DAOM 197198 / MUCL 43194) TaxID=747089 RepID=A0A2P4P4I0_RHIID|nr:hypothetical protein GLOIN_2v1847667 [Rhizophagus irregularis DAOM 181602=DAOM 197198]POG60285.1 hypothetical protein GLOIN_2v1847667 [Rhizophagus irregularis DAOM 181602=DAOM 197198]GET57092.1 hypothetical protein GLOIN_2v1847667 [Rhizophagus irregularis DAOM 181602=DAOM 197198]|eukprot:XP_025167151.1 hypothetical protein GLOIN_2v1847667 [Rhizophagus irregularis DAOM 181602=DAOM 197198]